MMKHPSLEVIEEDTALKLSTVFSDLETQSPSEVPWNLDRIDQRSNNLDGHYEPEGDGSNASIYVADTGVRYSHEEFEGRAHYAGFDAIDKLTGSDLKGADCEGHGTHCAGIAAGKTYGVAKKASIFSLRVLDCTGTGAVSGVIEGMGYVNQLTVNEMITSPVVLSMSLGSGKSSSFNTAIQQATSSGIVVVSAAGNEGGNSCKYSPASARSGIAVSATDKNDVAQSFSNAGKCIDIYAPGESIESAYSTCDTCRATLSGTSMSAPHVSGYIAIILSLNPEITSTDAKQKMIEDSTKNTVKLSEEPKSLIHDTPNRLLYVPHRN